MPTEVTDNLEKLLNCKDAGVGDFSSISESIIDILKKKVFFTFLNKMILSKKYKKLKLRIST